MVSAVTKLEQRATAAETALTDSVVQMLHRASQCANELFAEDRTGFDITARQYAVLEAVARLAGASQTDIVDATGIDRSTLADIMRRLVRRGFVHRRRTREDARAYALRLTELGQQALERARPVARAADERVLSLVPAGDRSRLLEMLTEIVNGLNRRSPAS